MPLTDEERAYFRSKIGGATASSGLPSGALPGMEVQSVTLGGKRPVMRLAPPKSETQAPTESERASTKVAQIALQNVQRIRQQLGVNESAGTVQTTKPLGMTVVTPDFMGGRPLRNPVAGPDAKQLRDDLENTFAYLALLRTGKQGESKQISNIRDTHNLGQMEAHDPQTIIRRLDDLERELRGFASGELTSPMDHGPVQAPALPQHVQSEMDRLLGR